MEFVERFKIYLLGNKNKPSKLTIKNYLADIRKFITWFEQTYQKPFRPEAVTNETPSDYKDNLNQHTSVTSIPSPRSAKRYLSSLRKFFDFLMEEGLITINPFKEAVLQTPADPWFLKDFSNYLYISKASKITIKNYLMDVKQFLFWATTVINETQKESQTVNLFSKIDTTLLEEYKNRLLHDAKLSPLSVNRKLSSLRKYLNWAKNKGIIEMDVDISSTNRPSEKSIIDNNPAPQISLEALSELENVHPLSDDEEKIITEAHYSGFAPIRLFQKIKKAINLTFDLLTVVLIANSLQSIKYNFWKLTGRKVFAALPEVLKENAPESVTTITNEILAKTAKSELTPKENLQSLFGRLVRLDQTTKKVKVTNIPKSIYAPLHISTKNLPFNQKFIYYLRHKRPQWYKKYHASPIAHYLHWGVLMIFVTASVFGIYRQFIEVPRLEKPVLAALPTSPPRILSFQGRLTDSSNTPITAETDLRFGIYTSQTASGSALIWQEVQHVTPNENGVFSVLLGKNTPMTQAIFANNSNLYLGIAVGQDSELQPRQQLATVAYAENAETLQGLAPITQPNAGTANVVLALDSAGNLTIGGTASPKFQASGGKFSLSGQTLNLTTNPASNGNVVIAPDGTGIIDVQKPLQNTTNNNKNASISGAVEVDDMLAVMANTDKQPAFVIDQSSTGALISASRSGVAKFTVNNDGSGIFAGDLAVNGTTVSTTGTTFNLINTGATTLNIGGAATSVSVGSTSGTTTINNAETVSGLATLNGGATIPSGQKLTVSGTVDSNLIPSSHNTYDLGSSTTYWNNAYISNLFTASSATTSGFFQRNTGALAPLNTSDDLLVGGSATSSALFVVSGTTGTITASSYRTGIVHSNSSGLFSSSAVNIASSDITGTLAIANGGTNATTIGSAGSIAYSNGTSYNFSGVGSTNQCLTSAGSGTPTWQSCALGGTTNWFTVNSGALSPINQTLDLVLGGTATTSAKFGFLNVAAGTPVASISAGTAGATFITADGSLQTTVNQTLTLGGTTTGNLVFNPLNGTGSSTFNGKLGVNTTSPTALLDVNGTASVSGALKLYGTPTIQATANQSLTIGGNTTGNIILMPLNGSNGVGIGTSTPRAQTFLNGVINFNGNQRIDVENQSTGTLARVGFIARADTGAMGFDMMGSGDTENFGNGLTAANLARFYATSGASGLEITTLGAGTPIYFSTGNTVRGIIDGSGRYGIGTQSPLATLGVRGNSATLPIASFSGSTNFAGLVVDNSGSGDLFTASSAGQTRFVIKQNGNVGIGTSQTNFKLDVQDSQPATAAASIYNSSTNPDADGLVIKLGATSMGTSCDTSGSCNEFITFLNGNGMKLGKISAQSDTSIAYKANGTDFAELFSVDHSLLPTNFTADDVKKVFPTGMLICLGNHGVVPCNSTNTTTIIGPVSAAPSFSGGVDGPDKVTLALVGQVPVLVSTENGAIHTGDPLTLSKTMPGYIMKATQAGFIVGKAEEDYTNQQPGTVKMFINLTWYNPDANLLDLGEITSATDSAEKFTLIKQDGTLDTQVGNFAQAAIAMLKTGLIQSQVIITHSLRVTSDNFSINGVSLSDYIATIVGKQNKNAVEKPTATGTAPLQPKTVNIDLISTNASDSAISITLDKSAVSIRNSSDASGAAVAVFDNQGNASFNGTLRAKKIIADEIEGLKIKAATISATYITTINNVTNNIYNSVVSQDALASASATQPASPSATPTISEPAENATHSATPYPSGVPSFPDFPTPQTTYNSDISTFSANFSNVPSLSTDFGKFNQGLIALGPSSMSDLSVSNLLSIGQSMTISENSINTIGADLEIQALRQGNLNIMGGLVAIDTDGNLRVSGNATFAKDVTVKGKLAANIIAPVPDQDLVFQLGETNDPKKSDKNVAIKDSSGAKVLSIDQIGNLIASGSGTFNTLAADVFHIVRGVQADTSITETEASGSAGTAVISAKETERTIISPHVAQNSLIYLTPASDTQGMTPYIARQTAEDPKTGTKGSFTIQITKPVNKDIKLNWWIVN